MTDNTKLENSELRQDTEGSPNVDTQFEFDCGYCTEVLQTMTLEAMQDQGMRHLESHKDALLEVFADKTRGKHCRNNCGYVFPVGRDEVAGFECPRCGHDNFEEFTHRYLYWQLNYR